ncbi:hypothetical protein PUN28_006790 [Cardiocondyla obscurior]|uniref:Uncharacterized protein n=1 Tax=Cardiocondyla obscurior TaxID=286306 RepID=A0AAW2G2V7_9HYME
MWREKKSESRAISRFLHRGVIWLILPKCSTQSDLKRKCYFSDSGTRSDKRNKVQRRNLGKSVISKGYDEIEKPTVCADVCCTHTIAIHSKVRPLSTGNTSNHAVAIDNAGVSSGFRYIGIIEERRTDCNTAQCPCNSALYYLKLSEPIRSIRRATNQDLARIKSISRETKRSSKHGESIVAVSLARSLVRPPRNKFTTHTGGERVPDAARWAREIIAGWNLRYYCQSREARTSERNFNLWKEVRGQEKVINSYTRNIRSLGCFPPWSLVAEGPITTFLTRRRWRRRTRVSEMKKKVEVEREKGKKKKKKKKAKRAGTT